MKKKQWILLICCSAAFFLYLFIQRVLAIFRIFDDPNGFSLLPILWAFVMLVLLLSHFGLYVMVMDKRERNHAVVDDEEWWRKWDRI